MKTGVMLNVAGICRHSEVNGPATRSVVWVQGCRRQCPGCINPHMQAFRAVKLVEPVTLAQQLCQEPDINGITLSGGEPFEQARACGILAETVKKQGKTVMVFSGFAYEQLITWRDAHIQHFLSQIDLLVAGPYLREQACESRLWQASRNQTVHFLTADLERFLPWQDKEVIEISTNGNQLMFTGFPGTEDIAWLEQTVNPIL